MAMRYVFIGPKNLCKHITWLYYIIEIDIFRQIQRHLTAYWGLIATLGGYQYSKRLKRMAKVDSATQKNRKMAYHMCMFKKSS